MSKRTGGDVVLEALVALGVDHVFAVASVHNLPILDAIRRRGGVTVINARHEQSAVHSADGYSRATGRLGVAFTSTGPGAANSMGGLFEAGFASSRVLMITGQVESRFYGQGRAYLHEAEQQLPMLRTLTRETWSVRRVEDVGEAVVTAGRAALTGRPQPTAVEIPVDLQYALTDVEIPVAAPVRPAAPREGRIAEAAELLASARRPMVWAGGGVLSAGAWDELRDMVERLQIPVVTSTQGRGALPEDHPLCLGSLVTSDPVRHCVESADVVLAVGTRFQMYPTGFWNVKLPPSLIHIDADASVIGRSYRPSVSVVADAKAALRALDQRVPSLPARDPDWVTNCRSRADEAREAAMTSLGPDHRAIVEVIRRLLPRGGAVVRDATVPAYNWGDRLLPILEPRTSVHPVSAAIGPGLPLGLGAALGRQERSVVIHGDGGIMLTIGELATLAQFQVPLTVCVFNDRGYGILRGIQAATFDGAQNDVDLATPDFVALAQAMGVPGEAVKDVAGFERAFATSVASDGPYLIEVDLTALAPMQVPIGGQELLS
ncbi:MULTISPECIES: thiamine pyrophosphate-binding protein [unclassified Blastococcus]